MQKLGSKEVNEADIDKQLELLKEQKRILELQIKLQEQQNKQDVANNVSSKPQQQSTIVME